MIDVLLFYPKLETIKPRLLPMSILSVAAPLVANGYKVKIIDQRVDAKWRETLVESLKESPLYVGISSMTGMQILNSLEASKIIKENGGTPIVWGGVHASLLPKQTLENKLIDFVVLGEGEDPLLKLTNALKNKTSYEEIDGLAYKKNEIIYVNQNKEFVDMDSLSDVPYHLIDINNYIELASFASGEKGRSIVFYTSRGCPHRCGFCYNAEFNKRKWRGESAERLVKRMEELIDKYGITSFEIEDDEFFVDMNRAKKVCELILQKKLNIDIFTTCRVNYVDQRMNDDLLKLCYDAGFRSLAFGVESGSPRVQKFMSKDITNEQVFNTIKRLKKAGIGSKYYFIAGAPTETVEDLYLTTNLIQAMKKLDKDIRIPSWRVFTPYPGTDLYQTSMDDGFVPPKSLEDWATYDFNTVKMPWVSRKARRIIENVIYSIKFLELESKSSNSFYFKLNRLYGKTIDWRWKKHLFYFPEKHLIKLILKIKHKIYE